MKKGSKYYPLFEFFKNNDREIMTLSFAEIESLVGMALPDSARAQRAWWSNRGRGALQATAWMGAGYHVEELNLEAERVTFVKPTLIYKVERTGDTVLWNATMIRGLRRHLGLTQKELADELGMRQQTISEWETGLYAPNRSRSKYLSLVAERLGFEYEIKTDGAEDE